MHDLSGWGVIRRVLLGAPGCVLCHETAAAPGVCSACAADIQTLAVDPAAHCPSCTRPSVGAVVCGACQRQPPPFARLHASLVYAPPLPALLQAFKYHGQVFLLPALAAWMQAHPPPWLSAANIDMVLPMPLSRQRLAQRGFNQSALLAEALAAVYGWRLMDRRAVLRQHRPPQSTLDRRHRQRNVRGIFHIHGDVKNRNLLLMDDVVTTGATVAELAQSLKRSGAAAVDVWTLAQAP